MRNDMHVPVREMDYEAGREHLLGCLLKQMNLKEIIHEAALLFGAPVILTTSWYRVLVMDDAGLPVDDPIWQTAQATGYCGADDIALFQLEGITHDVLTQNRSYILNSGIGSRIPRILSKVILSQKPAAYIGIFQISRPFDETDLRLTDLLCEILALIMSPRDETFSDVMNIRQSIISDLLSGDLKSSTVLNDRLRSAGWNTKAVFQCVLITPAHSSQGIDNGEYLTSLLCGKMEGSLSARVQEGILLILNFNEEETGFDFEKVFGTIPEQYDLYISISGHFRGLIYLKIYYESCLAIRRIARRQKRKERITHFDDVVFSAIADSLTKEEKLTFAQSKYRTLLAYDRRHETDYCHTLNVYIEEGCSVSTAAQKLFIHRNTMARRLERIGEITGMDIGSGRQLIHFYLTARMFHRSTAD